MKFQDKFYDIFDHNKCPPSETEDEKCIFRKSYFHRIQPRHDQLASHRGASATSWSCGRICLIIQLYKMSIYMI